MRPIGNYSAQAGIFLVKCVLRTELCKHEGLVGLPVFLPKVPAASKLGIQTRFRPLHPHSTVTSQDTGIAMTLTGYRASPTAVTLTVPSGPGWRYRRRDRPERLACAALRDTRAAPGPAARRTGDPVRRSARGRRSTPGGRPEYCQGP
jgi:hypothetical protein